MQSYLIKAIDIGTSKITAVIGQYYPSEDKLNIVGIASGQSLGFKKGQMINLEQATSTFKQLKESVERMTGAKFNDVHISISGTHFETINNQGTAVIVSPKNEITTSDIKKAIESSKFIEIPVGKEVLHTIPQKFRVDNQEGITDPTGMTGEKLTVTSTIIFGTSSYIRNIQKAIQSAGIQIDSISYSGLANGYVATNNTEVELGCIVIDIGGNETTVSVFSDGSLTNSFVIPVGDSNVTNDLAIGLRLPLDEAEQVKQTLQNINLEKIQEFEHNNRKINTTTAINGIIKPRLQDLFELIDNKLEEQNLKSKLQAGVILCGCGCLSPGIVNIATSIIRLPVKIIQITNIGGLMEDLGSPVYTTAIGLIKQQIKTNQSSTKLTRIKDNSNSIINKLLRLIKPLIP